MCCRTTLSYSADLTVEAAISHSSTSGDMQAFELAQSMPTPRRTFTLSTPAFLNPSGLTGPASCTGQEVPAAMQAKPHSHSSSTGVPSAIQVKFHSPLSYAGVPAAMQVKFHSPSSYAGVPAAIQAELHSSLSSTGVPAVIQAKLHSAESNLPATEMPLPRHQTQSEPTPRRFVDMASQRAWRQQQSMFRRDVNYIKVNTPESSPSVSTTESCCSSGVPHRYMSPHTTRNFDPEELASILGCL